MTVFTNEASFSGGEGEAGAVDVIGAGPVDGGQGGAKGWWRRWLVGGQEGMEKASVEFGVEDGHFEAVGGEGVAVGVRDSDNEAFEAESSQVVGHLRRAVGTVEQTT